jgi:dipeptidyl-peptidase-3
MRIKAEGDYTAIKALVERNAVHFDPKLRDQVVARYQKLGLPTYWAGINCLLSEESGPGGKMPAVRLSYPRTVEQQYLVYASMYDRSLLAGSKSMKSGK